MPFQLQRGTPIMKLSAGQRMMFSPCPIHRQPIRTINTPRIWARIFNIAMAILPCCGMMRLTGSQR